MPFGRTPLHLAARNADLPAVKELMLQGDINGVDAHGFTALYHATLLGHEAVMRILLDAGADLSQPDLGGLSPLHIACEKGRAEAAVLLCRRGADLAALDSIGRTPLDWASAKEHAEVIDAVRAWQAEAGANGSTPRRRVTWDEAALAEHERAKGVLYGTVKVEEVTTPFLYYSESVSRDEGALGVMVPGQGRQKVNIEELQARLGMLEVAQTCDGGRGSDAELALPPPPWLLLCSRSEPGERFYLNPATGETAWDVCAAASDLPVTVPGRDVADAVGAHAASGDEEEEEVPIPSSRLASARDCAAQAGLGAADARPRVRGHGGETTASPV